MATIVIISVSVAVAALMKASEKKASKDRIRLQRGSGGIEWIYSLIWIKRKKIIIDSIFLLFSRKKHVL